MTHQARGMRVGGVSLGGKRPSLVRSVLVAAAVSIFVLLGLVVPILVGGRSDGITLRAPQVQAALRDSFVVSEPLRLLAAPLVMLERGTVSIAPDKQGRPRSGEMIAAMLRDGTARLVVEDATLVVDLSAVGEDDLAPGQGTAPLLAAVTKLGFETLSLRRGVIVVKRASQPSDVFSDVRLDLVHRKGSSLSATGTFDLQGRQLAIDTTLGLAVDKKSALRLPLKGSVKGSLLEATVTDGRLELGPNPRITAAVAEVNTIGLRQCANWLGALWPGERGLGAFRAKGQMELSDRSIAFQNAAFQMDGNEATGSLALTWGKARPFVEGTLALKKLDLAAYVGAGTTEASRAGLSWLGIGSEPGVLSLPIIKHVDADVRISTDKISAGPLTLGKSAASVAVNNGKLLADIAEVDLGGNASAIGQLTVDMNGARPRYVLRGKLESIETAALATAAVGLPVLAGRGDLAFDVAGTGETVSELGKALSGKVGLVLSDGGVLGLDIAQLAAAASQKAEYPGWGSAARGRTSFDQLTARCTLNGGVLSADSVKLTIGERQISATGRIELTGRQLDGEILLGKVPQSERPGEDAAATEGRVEVLGVRGDWSSPSVSYSTRPSRSARPAPPPGGDGIQPATTAIGRHPG